MDTKPNLLAEIDWPRLPRLWREKLIPAELPGLTREIVTTIMQQIPEYHRALDGPYGKATRRSVEEALTTFVAQVSQTGALSPAHVELFRGLGRGEALEGRSHDALQAAYRIGSKLAWRRIMIVNESAPLPPTTVARLAAAVFGFVDLLAAVSAEGFAAGRLQGAQMDTVRRIRLLQLLLDQPASPSGVIAELASSLGWELPDEVTVVDVADESELDDRDLGEFARARFGAAALAGRVSAGSVVLLPGVLDDYARDKLKTAEFVAKLSIGCPVPLAQAATSLRWAQLASRLVAAGVLADLAVTFCEDELPTLLLHSERSLHDQLIRRRLGPLLALSPSKRLKFGKLLSAWLELGCTQGELAATLEVHRQTVHYQFTRLSAMFGEQLHDRTARVELLLALRAALPEWQAGSPTPGERPAAAVE
jgi:hypothetical protein